MECPRCHNQDITYFSQINGKYYCRKCIVFSQVYIQDSRLTRHLHQFNNRYVHYTLDFPLTYSQQMISQQLLKNYQKKKNSYVWAVCGSGKTEIVYETIQFALNQGHRICFCAPRKELVKELYNRIKQSFQNIEIGLLYGGYCFHLDAQLIVCTTHQLYRFENNVGFDLMIVDEVDAFPFYENDVLQALFYQCCLGTYIQLSATFIEKEIHDGELLIMNRRYHGHDLPIPHLRIVPFFLQKWMILWIVLMHKKKWIIYVPTISQVESVVTFLQRFIPFVDGVSSQTKDISIYLEKLRCFPFYILVSTTILERGITIEDVHVIVYQTNHFLFDRKTLIQIAGRVGRKPQHPQGNIYFLSSSQSKEMRQCIKTIQRLNKMSV